MEESGINEDHPLHSLVKSLSKRLLDARSDSTVKKYYYSFMKWEKLAKVHSLISLPASPIHVFLLDSGATYSTVSSAFYSIKWAHDMCGQLDPTGNTFVKHLVESAKRTAKAPVVKKDPVSTDILISLVDILISLCTMFQGLTDLTVVRDLTMILLCYSAFLRFSELSQLKCHDITVKDDYLVVKITKRVKLISTEQDMKF